MITETVLNSEIVTNIIIDKEEVDTVLSVLTDKDQYYFRTNNQKWTKIKQGGHYGKLKIHPIADLDGFYNIYEVKIYYNGYRLSFAKLDAISKEEFECKI